MATGTVREWSDDDGWGILDSDETPDGCWAHYSVVATPVISVSGVVEVSEFKTLTPGDAVDFEWEASSQNGFRFRATSVAATS